MKMEVNNGEQCTHCRIDSTPLSTLIGCLPPKTILQERYIIDKVLGRSGFEVTYLAFDKEEECRVVLKEYFPDTLVFRQPGELQVSVYSDDTQAKKFRIGAEKFYTEAQAIAQFQGHPVIVGVKHCFYENQTAYCVMEYLEGINLKRYMEQEKTLSLDSMLKLFLPVLDTLVLLHFANILHRDISPDNIFILNDGTVKLSGFGSAHQIVSEQTGGLAVILKAGYSPIEQYQSQGKQGPWTDIYALAATMYYCLTGTVPMASIDRVEEDSLKKISELCPELGQEADAVFAKALAVRGVNRYQSVIQFRDDLLALNSGETITPAMIETQAVSKKKNKKLLLVLIIVVLICGTGIIFVIRNRAGNIPEVNQTFEELPGLTNTPTPGPTDTPTPEPTDTPTPEPTSTPTPEPTSTPTPEPTSTPTPEPTSTPMPEPTSTPTPEPTGTPTPEPTSTPTPEPTNTPIPKPTNTPMPTPNAAGNLLPKKDGTNPLLHFYSGYVEETEVIWEGKGWGHTPKKYVGVCYKYADGSVIDIPEGMLEIGEGYIRFRDEFLVTLEPSVYEMIITVSDFPHNAKLSDTTSVVLEVHDKDVIPERTEQPVPRAKYVPASTRHYGVSTHVSNWAMVRFTGAMVSSDGGATYEKLDETQYKIEADGRVMSIDKRYLGKFEGVEEFIIVYTFDDGSAGTMALYFYYW